MSGVAAVIHFDGRPVEEGVIERMTDAMSYRGPDGINHWIKGNVALGHCMLHTTAESVGEVQPFHNDEAGLSIVFDGWLSNWEELRHDFLSRGLKLRTTSDVELVLKAYEIWGEDCAKRIDGEFAFVVWDRKRREAYAAGDHIGLKVLHYRWDGSCLIIASDITGVLAHPQVMREPNYGRIGEYLTFDWATRGQTLWQQVMRAVPAHWIRFKAGSLEEKKYWEPPFEVSINYARDEDYFEHYRELFFDTIRSSSRSHRPLACDVSGGLDSSAVFAVSNDLLKRGCLQAPDLKGYTYHFENASGMPHDEIAYARAVAGHVGKSVREISPFRPELSWFSDRTRADADIAGYPNGAMSIAIGNELRNDGCRVILNGEGGDEWTAGKPFYFAEQLAARDWEAFARSLREDASELGPLKAIYNAVRFGVLPRLPRQVLDFRKRLTNRRKPNDWRDAFWLSDNLKRLLPNGRPQRSSEDSLRIDNLARRAMYMVLTDPFALVVWDQSSRQSARLGYEIRSPLYARKYIEFAFSTPERIRLRGGKHKYVHIGALRDLLPGVVAERTTKADFTVAFRRLLPDAEALLIRGKSAGDFDFFADDGLAKLFEQHHEDPQDVILIWHLWTIFEIERLFNGPAI